MSEQILQVPLKQIRPSPFQMRQAEDPAVVRQIADSIAKDGLQEYPKVRQVGEIYELVFGHTRLAAYQLLHKERGAEFESMPVIVTEIRDDRQMFELGLVENVKRQDLNAIEVATAMKVHMETFEATSEETGKLFGVAAATVRGKVRLLDLPKVVTDQVASGEISELDARSLLVVNKLAPDKIAAVAEEAKGHESYESFADVVESSLREVKGVVDLGYQDKNEKTFSVGRNGWPLDLAPDTFPRQFLPPIKPDAKEAEHLANPPACSSCPFHAKLNDRHYCGLDVCYQRKTTAWLASKLEEASKKTKIAVYDPGVDGKSYEEVSNYGSSPWEKLFGSKDKDLRLMPDRSSYGSSYKGLPGGVKPVRLVAAQKGKPTPGGGAAKANKPREDVYARRVRLEQEREPIYIPFIWQAMTTFTKALKITAAPMLDQLLRYGEWEEFKTYVLPKGQKVEKQTLDFKQRLLAFDYLVGVLIDQKDLYQGKLFLVDIARELDAQAKAWGVSLPGSVIKAAKAYHASVAEETKAKPKKKAAKKGKKK
jgi:ParB/RepB/Spo0J family partition protein